MNNQQGGEKMLPFTEVFISELIGKLVIDKVGNRVGKVTDVLIMPESGFPRICGVQVKRTWDFGFHRPAVLYSQVNEKGQWFVLREILGKDEHLDVFANRVIPLSNQWFPNAQFEDYCDVAGTQKNDRSDLTSVDILRRKGINPRFRRFDIDRTIDIVQRKLTSLIDGKPVLLVDKRYCPVLIDGFRGGYYYEKPKDGRDMAKAKPCKDGYYEHLMDCLRYTAGHSFDSDNVSIFQRLVVGGPSWGGV
jgi:sporulation protein YlmC with PRC-barrel domain